jgi:acyl dehydratase
MADLAAVVGKSYPPTLYAVGREKVKEYARVTGESDALHLDHEAARAAGYADVVAPPMFAVVYCGPAMGPALFDPELDINFSRLVHGGQEFKWGPLVVAGDDISTVVSVKSIEHRAGNGFFVFESVSTNQDGHTVSVGTWTNIVRGE